MTLASGFADDADALPIRADARVLGATLKAGESLTLPDRAIHNEGATDKAVKLNAVYVVEKGKPLASPAP